jgi:recombination protein RecR
MNPGDILNRLSSSLAKLPGVGKRSAERMALKLARDTGGLVDDLVAALKDTKANICCCANCGSVTSVDENPCRLCTDPGRDGRVLCVVEDPSDVQAIDRCGGYHGRYHSLMGKLAPAKGDGPKQIRVDSLLARIDKEKIEEVILALSTDVEGDATASYICQLLKDRKIKVTRLASGLPAGSGVMYSDAVTLAKAIKGRQGM